MFNNRYVFGDQNVKNPADLNFGKFILDRLRLWKDEVALEYVEFGGKMTYKELTQTTVNLAVALGKLGVGVKDTVAVGSEKRKELVPTVLSIVLTGATYTPYDLKSGRAVLKHKLTITQPKYLICSNLFWSTYSDILKSFDCIQVVICLDNEVTDSVISVKTLIANNVDADLFEPKKVQGQTDVAFILYSSGTTGMPKGVQLTHRNCVLNSIADDLQDQSFKTVYLCGSWNHNYNTFMTYKFLTLGRRIICDKDPSPVLLLKAVQDHQVDIVMVLPSLVEYISKSSEVNNYNLDSLKVIYSRSSPLHVKTIDNVKKRLPKLKNILQGYGMTESGEPTSENWGTKGPKPGSVGMASPGITVKVVDPDKNETLGPNKRGEIRLKGPGVMKGYLGIDPSTYLDEDGFFKTGDLGYYDEDNYFYIVDRLKEIIVYDGFQIAPVELEAVLLLHPAVKEAGVVGKPVPIYEEVPMAFVVKQPGFNVTEEELMAFVALEVSPLMQLRGGVKFVEEIPRNASGKILRRQLREYLLCEATLN